MQYFEHYLLFPEGDKQPLNHALHFGDIVDINGNVFNSRTLNPRQITYRVCGIKKEYHFKEVLIHYKLELLTSDEVEGEKKYQLSQERKRKEKLNKAFSKLEKRYQKRKRK